MKALVYEGPRRLALRDVPVAAPRSGESLIRVAHVGICGSDMHAWDGHDERRPAPLILGHEAAGVVIEGPLNGARVTVNPLVTCGACDACRTGRDNLCPDRQIISMPPREGAFAELVALPPENLIRLPDDFPLDHAALCEPLACGVHAVAVAARVLRRPVAEAVCLVIGAGPIGLAAALALAAEGAPRIVVSEPSPARRAAAADAGPFEAVAPEQTRGLAPHLVIDAVGFAPTRAAASACVRPGGAIVHIGLGAAEGGLDVRRMTLQEIAFVGVYTYTKADFARTAAMMAAGDLGALDWFETAPLADGAAAFDRLAAGAASAPKILLTP